MLLVKSGFEILTPQHTIDGMLQRIEAAGRTCYRSEDKITDDSAEKFVRMIAKRGHESVIEHESMSVRIICDRGVSHEALRHRLASYSMESTRYCSYAKEKFGSLITCIDISEHAGGDVLDHWLGAMANAERSYFAMLEAGASPQIARSVLPNSLKTEFVMTCNLREWRHVFKMRTSKAAHPQIREIMRPMLVKFRELIPVIFDDVGEV